MSVVSDLMPLFNFRKSLAMTRLGVDFQRTQLVFAERSVGDRSNAALNGHVIPIPCELPLDRWIESGGLKQVLQQNRRPLSQFRQDCMCCVLPHELTRMYSARLPQTGGAEMRSLVGEELSDFMSVSVDELTYDYWAEPETDDEGMVTVHAVVASRALINQVLRQFRSVGLRCATMDSRTTCLSRLIGEPVEGVRAVIEWAADDVTMVMFRDGIPFYTRRLRDSHWELLVDELIDEWKISRKDCETIIRRLGKGPEVSRSLLSNYQECVEALVVRFAEEVQRTLNFARQKSHFGAIDRLVMTGSGSGLPLIREELGRAFSEPIAYASDADLHRAFSASEFDLAVAMTNGRIR
ncbi:hypothetical protein [Rubinisphaera margarita]|uniref:hypothetical protein n=1 Tax=Rubinisphaera margarita TaxID=2909586 RepID=UPI001EE7E119|nr:hypothetical protein [Rubinisphaera margarita]MCG6155834.1 hypothetical protein [Rubinisphaera margarita]